MAAGEPSPLLTIRRIIHYELQMCAVMYVDDIQPVTTRILTVFVIMVEFI